MTIIPKDFFLPFLKKEKVSKDAYSFYFDRKSSDFIFLPGQYIRMTLPIENPDERGKSRFFSVSSSPLEKDYLTVTTRIIQSSFKKSLAELVPGTQVKFFGPTGQFIFYEEEIIQHVFLAGGIGITPFRSMITYAAAKRFNTSITLFASFSTVEDMIFYNELTEIATNNPNIKIVYTITHPENLQTSWQGETGRISENLIKRYITDPLQSLCYIAGPPIMVLGMETMVKEMGIAQEKIKKENFIGY